MKNKRVEVPLADINAGTVQTLNPVIEIVRTSINEDDKIEYWYPIGIQIINDCGKDVQWNCVSNKYEETDSITNPSNYAFIRLPSLADLQDMGTNIGKMYKFYIQGYGGSTATSDLIVEFKNYQLRS